MIRTACDLCPASELNPSYLAPLFSFCPPQSHGLVITSAPLGLTARSSSVELQGLRRGKFQLLAEWYPYWRVESPVYSHAHNHVPPPSLLLPSSPSSPASAIHHAASGAVALQQVSTPPAVHSPARWFKSQLDPVILIVRMMLSFRRNSRILCSSQELLFFCLFPLAESHRALCSILQASALTATCPPPSCSVFPPWADWVIITIGSSLPKSYLAHMVRS